jgi:hypothetical protein
MTIEDLTTDTPSRRRSTRRTLVLVAAAAAVVVGAPTALLVRSDGGAPGPTPSPPSPTTSRPAPAHGTPSAGGAALRGIPLGRAPGITWLHAGTVHLGQGGTTTLPDPNAPVMDFTSYHGGWLVGLGEERVRWYDGTGTRRSDGPGLGILAVSEDGTRTAYARSGTIHIGITSGMGDGEQTVPAGADPWPVGFLRGGALVYQARARRVRVTNGSTVPGMEVARAVSAEDDLIAGSDRRGNTVVVSPDGQVAWTSTWTVWGFSTDGRYAAASASPTGGDDSALAILDAHTGAVVAQHDSLLGRDVGLGSHPVMDVDGSLLVAATSGNLEQTVLRLDRNGRLTRATRVFPLAPSTDTEYIAFATRP